MPILTRWKKALGYRQLMEAVLGATQGKTPRKPGEKSRSHMQNPLRLLQGPEDVHANAAGKVQAGSPVMPVRLSTRRGISPCAEGFSVSRAFCPKDPKRLSEAAAKDLTKYSTQAPDRFAPAEKDCRYKGT